MILTYLRVFKKVFLLLFWSRALFFVSVGDADLLACKPIYRKWIKLKWESDHHVCVVGCDCFLSDTDESHPADFDVKLQTDLGLLLFNRVCF